MDAQVRHRIAGHRGAVNAAIFDATGAFVVSGGADGRIQLSSADSGRAVQWLDGQGHAVHGVALSTDARQLASCGGRTVFVWDVSAAQITRRLGGHRERVDCVAMGGDSGGSVVASGSFDRTVRLWDMRAAQRTPVQELDDSRDGVAALAFAGDHIVAASADGSVRTYDVRAGRMTEDVLGAPVVSVAVAGSVLAAGCMDGSVQLLDRGSGRALAAFTGHVCERYRVQCDASAAVVASGSEDGAVCLWSAEVPPGTVSRNPHRLRAHHGAVTTVRLHPRATDDPAYKSAMVSAGADGAVVVWGLCHSAFWGKKLQNKYLVEQTMRTTPSHHHLVYEAGLPKPYRIVYVDPDGEDPDDMAWANRGHEEKARRRIRLKITVDEENQVHEVECG